MVDFLILPADTKAGKNPLARCVQNLYYNFS